MVLSFFACFDAEAGRGPVGGAVAADHVLASEAGAEMLRQGGNAMDAAVAAALSSGVVQPTGSGLGGGGFAIVAKPGQPPFALDFREVAPAAATADMFAGGASSTKGGLAVAVPAEALGLVELHEHYGRLPLKKVIQPALRQAERGFEPGPHLLAALADRPGMRSLFGESYRRTRLGKALRALASTRGEAFRSGWVAQDFVDSVQAAGGVLTMADLAAYRTQVRNPLVAQWEGRTVLSFPPPSSGGVALLQLLRATEGSGSRHCLVEAAKHAMADRAAYGGDPSFTPVPVDRLLDVSRITAIKADCAESTFPAAHYAPAPPPPDDHGTLHISTIDDEGLAVALTTTINLSFGSEVVGAASGIVLNDQMDDFATRGTGPNAFGLVQGAQNAPQPGKRPLSSMTPTILLDAGGRPELVAGASGGPFIITATFQAIRAVVVEGASAELAVSGPRWHHQWQPDVLVVEKDWPHRAELEAHGHQTRTIEHPFSSAQVVLRRDGRFEAASDPRKGGEAVVVER